MPTLLFWICRIPARNLIASDEIAYVIKDKGSNISSMIILTTIVLTKCNVKLLR